MTGPEHFQAAEAALDEAGMHHGPDEPMYTGLMMLANAHAALATAAATGLGAIHQPQADWEAWRGVASLVPPDREIGGT